MLMSYSNNAVLACLAKSARNCVCVSIFLSLLCISSRAGEGKSHAYITGEIASVINEAIYREVFGGYRPDVRSRPDKLCTYSEIVKLKNSFDENERRAILSSCRILSVVRTPSASGYERKFVSGEIGELCYRVLASVEKALCRLESAALKPNGEVNNIELNSGANPRLRIRGLRTECECVEGKLTIRAVREL